MRLFNRRNIFILAMLAAIAIPSGCGGGNAPGVSLKTPPIAQGGTQVDGTQVVKVVKISSSGSHSCVLDSAGGVKCWGSNNAGQIGDGTEVDRSAPVAVSGMTSGITAVAAGGAHTCVITTVGGVKCWGYNENGQLGDGTKTNRKTPVDAFGLTSGVIAVASGSSHTCVLMTGGGVKCWGYNNYGELGDGTNTDRTAPVNVSGLTSGVVAIAAGASHTCALTTVGGIRCWGSNSNGQLGDGTKTDRTSPVDTSGLTTGIIEVSAGGAHTCALTTGGGIKCWGYNYYGMLGDGTRTDRTIPVDVSGMTTGVIAVSAGSIHTCALTTGGAVKCWGDGNFGSNGDGTISFKTTPGYVSGLESGAVEIAASSMHTCALTTGGGVKCWGYNREGELGIGSTANITTPVVVYGLTSGVTAVAGGLFHTCAIAAGGVKCWGENDYLELGDGTDQDRATPVNVSGLTSGISSIATGKEHSCALTAGGGVKCWGRNIYGELGDGTETAMAVPVDVFGLTSGVAAIAAGGSHTCALTTGGGVKCWGENSGGLLGDGTTTNRTIPVEVSGLSSGVAAIAAGEYFNCALTTAGGVKCWGVNKYGWLGDGTMTSRTTPGDVSGLTSGVAAIASHRGHTCVVTTGGGVKCWGDGEVGQLGDGTINNYRMTPVDVLGLSSGVTAIAVGEMQSCAILIGGGLKCWGHNYKGEVGDGTTTLRVAPVNVSGLASAVVKVAAGDGHTCAITTGGGLKCWGNNEYGQVGDGNAWKTTPVDVVGF